MTKILKLLIFICLIILFLKCNNSNSILQENPENLESILPTIELANTFDTLPDQLGHGYDFEGNGKDDQLELQESFSNSILDSFPLPQMDESFKEGLKNQLRILRHAKVNGVSFDDHKVVTKDLSMVINHLLEQENGTPISLDDFTAYQLEGEDRKGNVHFTGYFTPILKVRKEKDSIFQHPIYRYPIEWKGKLPSRKEIVEDEVLKGRNLEIAYAKDLFSIYTMQVQGSGIVEFENGEQKLLAFAGGNQHPYTSIGRHMIEEGYMSTRSVSLERIKKYFEDFPHYINEVLNVNQSYVFFSPQDSKPIGAGNHPLTPYYSIAVDRQHIPLGSVLLANIPILDTNNEISHHEWRLVLAQDVGAAIKGPGHVDLYMGVGIEARRQASFLHHYGQLYIILPETKDKSLAIKE